VSKKRRPLAQETLSSWLKAGAAQASLTLVINRAVFVKRFLDWLVERDIVPENPFSQLRVRYSIRSPPRRWKRSAHRHVMPASWARSFANMSNECGLSAFAIATRIGSSASTGIYKSSLTRKTSLSQSWRVTT
jgi:hypothetical protein